MPSLTQLFECAMIEQDCLPNTRSQYQHWVRHFYRFNRKPRSPDRILVAREAIVEDLKRRALLNDPTVGVTLPRDAFRWHHPQSNYYWGTGEMPCPVCNAGILRYSRSGHNGHVGARCSNAGCVAWME